MKTTNLRRVATMVFLSLLAIPVCGTTVEQMPSYPGGEMALLDYFQKNLQCPKEVEQAGVHGNVDVSFVIAKSGAVENVQAIKTVLLKRSGVPCQDSTLIKLCEREAGIHGGHFPADEEIRRYRSGTDAGRIGHSGDCGRTGADRGPDS